MITLTVTTPLPAHLAERGPGRGACSLNDALLAIDKQLLLYEALGVESLLRVKDVKEHVAVGLSVEDERHVWEPKKALGRGEANPSDRVRQLMVEISLDVVNFDMRGDFGQGQRPPTICDCACQHLGARLRVILAKATVNTIAHRIVNSKLGKGGGVPGGGAPTHRGWVGGAVELLSSDFAPGALLRRLRGWQGAEGRNSGAACLSGDRLGAAGRLEATEVGGGSARMLVSCGDRSRDSGVAPGGRGTCAVTWRVGHRNARCSNKLNSHISSHMSDKRIRYDKVEDEMR
ncbi:hypothetical protein DFP72DRAFT_853908 [Ephemerocybe angulata]|uniref:Uncharacterized protein n=1 Tax=Ephemerocybe angulata TaxID=980116 RepID=A0A8H6HKG6_9AGAR|nr:hypothetical protein DFP72DRAFT_853908 [Tulosesus angulatus]